MYCEKCKKSFEEKTICPVCGTVLINYTPILDEEDARDLEAISPAEPQTEESATEETVEQPEENAPELDLLVATPDAEEADKIKDLLEVNSIPVIEKSAVDDDGAELTEIYVPEELVSQCLDIIGEILPEELEEEMSDEELDAMLEKLAEETASESEESAADGPADGTANGAADNAETE